MVTIEGDHNDDDDDLLVAVKGSKFTSLMPWVVHHSLVHCLPIMTIKLKETVTMDIFRKKSIFFLNHL